MIRSLESFANVLPGLPDPDRMPGFYARVPSRRLVAWVVDMAIIIAIGVPLALAFGLATLGFGLLLFPLVMLGTSLAYRTLTLAGGSATWGMRFVGIELRRHDGLRLDGTTAFLHTLLYTVCFAAFPLQILSMIGMISTRYGQGLPDLVLRTAMINRPAD
jgi:uncharacterized RDD family membrane protein YckC